MTKPCTDEIIPINDDLNVVYSRWENGSSFRRLDGWWGFMQQREFVPPTENPTLLRLAKLGLHLAFVEHVSFTVAGKAFYRYDTPEGFSEDIGLPGEHNVENGGGYLSLHAFTRWAEDDHVTCCIVPNPERKSKTSYSFGISDQRDDKAAFSHLIQGYSPDTYIIGRIRG